MGIVYTTQREIRRSFWKTHPDCARGKLRSGDYVTDTRCAFVDYVDYLSRCGMISEELAQRVTL